MTTYAERLREALNRDGWSQRRLAKELAARTGNAVESERSSISGYLTGAVPRPERAQLIAEITGLTELAEVTHPRRSAAARLEDRLLSIEAGIAQILEFQIAAAQVIAEALGRPDVADELLRVQREEKAQ